MFYSQLQRISLSVLDQSMFSAGEEILLEGPAQLSYSSHLYMQYSQTNRQLIRALIRLQTFLFSSCKREAKLGLAKQKG